MKKILSVVAMSLLLAPQVEADTRSVENILKECGLGGVLFKDVSPALAMVSNIVWDLGTTATLSDLSGACPGDKKAKVALFVASSYDKLETEVTAGQGKYVETLAELSGKSVTDIRAEYKTVVAKENFSTLSTKEKANKLFSIAAY